MPDGKKGLSRRAAFTIATVFAAVGLVVAPASARSEIDDIAAANHMPREKVERILQDRTARVGANKRIYYVEDQAPRTAAVSSALARGATPTPAPGAPVQPGPFPYTQTFTLHSNAGSNRLLYLDFRGRTITGTGWNSDPTLGTPASFKASRFALDTTVDDQNVPAATSVFTTAEQDVIQSVWQRVAEDYAPFNIDVTTEDPGDAAIDGTGGSTSYGTRALITNTSTIYTGCNCSGIAYVGTYNPAADGTPGHAYYQPAFIFNKSDQSNAKFIGDGVSHETGHNLGLNHQGTVQHGTTPAQDYYGGQGDWGPIMGSPFQYPVTQWAKGEYQYASRTEDEYQVMQTTGGVSLLTDPPHGTLATATVLPPGSTFSASGTIISPSDVDVYKFTAAAGAATFAVTPAAPSPDLDVVLELRDSAGTLLSHVDPPSTRVNYDQASGLDASLSTNLPADGDYYISVFGTGYGDPLVTGYTSYGSRGRYALSGTIQVPNPTAFHPLAPSRVLDSRPPPNQVGAYGTPWGPGSSRDVQISGLGGVPASAVAVVLNATVTNTTGNSFATIWPTGTPRPLASSLNWVAGQTIPNAVTVKLGTSGMVSAYTYAGNTDLIFDVVGYYDTNAGAGLTSLSPTRILDSRPSGPQAGAYSTPWGPGQSRDVAVTGVGGVPANARAVVLNATVTNTTAPSYLTIWPTGVTRPTASSLNWAAGTTIPNAVTVSVGTGGNVSVFNSSGSTDVLFDVVGYFSDGAGALFHPLAPSRIQDSRATAAVGAYTTPWGTASRDVQVGGLGGIPTTGTALLNVTVTNTTASSYLTVWPAGTAAPLASSLNWVAGTTIPNAVTAKLSSSGAMSVQNNLGSVDVIADTAGWYG